jgi:multicomponent K+:H+ antiporter subunit E
MVRTWLRHWIPHPLLSLALLLIWLLLNNSLGLGNLLLGSLLALMLSRLTANFWPERPRIAKPVLLVRYLVRLMGDILVANLQVAVRILGPKTRLRPAFIEVPLDLTDPFAITLLASVISLTPGTVSADLIPGRPERGGATLLVHSLDVDDPVALSHHLKQRYEAPLREIFR